MEAVLLHRNGSILDCRCLSVLCQTMHAHCAGQGAPAVDTLTRKPSRVDSTDSREVPFSGKGAERKCSFPTHSVRGWHADLGDSMLQGPIYGFLATSALCCQEQDFVLGCHAVAQGTALRMDIMARQGAGHRSFLLLLQKPAHRRTVYPTCLRREDIPC
jgi:hypothetical protein